MKPLVILEAFGTLPETPSDTAERQRESTHREEQPTVEAPVGLLHRASTQGQANGLVILKALRTHTMPS